MILPPYQESLTVLSPEEIATIKQEFVSSGTIQSKFNYAYALLRSANKSDNKQAVYMFQDIYNKDQNFRREMTYYLAMAYYKLGQYANAKREIEMFLVGGEVPQATDLHEEINSKIRNEALVGAGIIGTGVAIAGFVLSRLMRK